MKFLTYRAGDALTPRIGLFIDNRVVDLGQLVAGAKDSTTTEQLAPLRTLLASECGDPMVRLLESWTTSLASIRDILATISVAEQMVVDDATILAPVPRPTSMRDGYAFRQHVEAARRNRGVPMIPEFDDFPVFYFTNHQAVTGPGEVFVRDEHLDRLDFELECAIVIGREGRDIPASEGDDHVAGFMVMNDWSARRLQMDEMKLNLGPAKGKDFATSLGPWLVTADELSDRRIEGPVGARYNLTMTAYVNGVAVSEGNMADMSWTFAQIVERASYGVTLYPGDVIGSGTVGTGCFLELNGSKVTDNWWLKEGDVVDCSIERLGSLTNTIRRYSP